MPRRRVPFFLLLALAFGAAGCSSHYDMQDLSDEGQALETKGSFSLRAKNYHEAAEFFAQATSKYLPAHEIAVERNNVQFKGYLALKLAGSFGHEALCRRPDKDGLKGDWDKALELYQSATTWGSKGFLRMQRDMIVGQAECIRPDNNPKGNWKEAAKRYEQALSLSEEIEDDQGIGANSRALAICLLEGPNIDRLDERTRKLLIRANRHGDVRAAELLSETGSRFCFACAKKIDGDVRFCPKCGQDQVKKVKPPARIPPRQAPPE